MNYESWQKNKDRIIESIWFVAILVLFIFTIILLRNGSLQEKVASFGVWAPLLVFILKTMTLVVAPLGGTPIYVLSGALFGNWPGFLLVITADIFGSAVCFFISRKYGVKVLSKFVGKQNINRVLSSVDLISNSKSFTKARLGFVSMPELLAYAAGLSKINFFQFTWINALFYLPMDFVLVFLGSQIATLSAKYFFIVPAVFFVLTISGVALLYKDYQKLEGS